jgi:hypothetical protein
MGSRKLIHRALPLGGASCQEVNNNPVLIAFLEKM